MDSPFWSGRHYELNMSFATLRDAQWSRLLGALWEYVQIAGPLTTRFVPDQSPAAIVDVQLPAPTATYTQHGVLHLGEWQLGLDVLVTRSLFECVSLIVPEGMFSRAEADGETKATALSALRETYGTLALHLYQAVPFEIAVLGWDRECQLRNELAGDSDLRAQFLERGGCLVQDGVLRQLGATPNHYEELLPGLRWLPDKSNT